MSPIRKRIGVNGEERKWIGPRFNPKNNVPIPEHKPKHGPEVKMSTQLATLNSEVFRRKQNMSVYDYLDMSKVMASFHDSIGMDVSDYRPRESQHLAELGNELYARGTLVAADSKVESEKKRQSEKEDIQNMGMTRWDMNQKILSEHWNVIQRWEAQSRERGSLVGLSRLGQKLNKLNPPKRVRIPGIDEPEPVIPLPSMESLGLQRINVNAEFANVTKWQIGFGNPDNKLAHLRTVQAIVVRESLILQLDNLLKHIEQLYYEYALLRMQSADLNIPSNSEQIVSKKAVVLQAQVELRVAIANYRTATMQVFEEFLKWRSLCRKDANLKDANIVMTWHGENYFLKMTRDICPLYRYSVLRLWLDFEPNMLMLPPTQLSASDSLIRQFLINTASNADGSLTSPVSANAKDTFNYASPDHLPPLDLVSDIRGEEVRELDEDMSQLSQTSDYSGKRLLHNSGKSVDYRTYCKNRVELYHSWLVHHQKYLVNKRQEFLKNRRIDEQLEKEQRAQQEMVDLDIKRLRAKRYRERHELEEQSKREKNFKILRIHQNRADAGEDAERIKNVKSKEEIALDEQEVEERAHRDLVERELQHFENEEKARRDAIFKSERDAKARALKEQDERRFDDGISQILEKSAPLIQSSVQLDDGKEWQAVRNICLSSWKCIDLPDDTTNPDGTVNFSAYNDASGKMLWQQGPDVAPTFWNNCEISPLVVEASVGFKELWPYDSAIVPPLPEKLFTTCTEFRRFLKMEQLKWHKLQDREHSTQILRDSVHQMPSIAYFDTHGFCGDSSADAEASIDKGLLAVRMDDDEGAYELAQEKLRRRQESDGNLVDGSLRIYKEIANLDPKRTGLITPTLLHSVRGDGKYQMLRFNAATVTTTTDNIFEGSVIKSTQISQGMDESSDRVSKVQNLSDDVFVMTRPVELGDECDRKVDFKPSSVSSRVGIISGSKENNHLLLSAQAHPTGLAAVTTKPLTFCETVVSDQRRLITRDAFQMPFIRPEQQNRHPPDYTRPYWRFRLAVRIQSLIRGFITRRRLQRTRKHVKFMACVLKIQSQFRRVIGTRIFQEKKLIFQSNILELRRMVLKRHEAALAITKFIRLCADSNTGQTALNPLLAYAKSAAKARSKAKAKASLKRGLGIHGYSHNASMTTTDGTSMTVRHGRSSRQNSPAASPIASRNTSRGRSSGAGDGMVEPGEFGDVAIPVENTQLSRPKEKISLENIFKRETRSGSRLIPLTVKPGTIASQPGTSKPRFRPFAARTRDFVNDVHLPAPEKTVKHPNECYRPPPALLTRKQREVVANEIATKLSLDAENGIEVINRNKYEAMKSTLRAAMTGKF